MARPRVCLQPGVTCALASVYVLVPSFGPLTSDEQGEEDYSGGPDIDRFTGIRLRDGELKRKGARTSETVR